MRVTRNAGRVPPAQSGEVRRDCHRSRPREAPGVSWDGRPRTRPPARHGSIFAATTALLRIIGTHQLGLDALHGASVAARNRLRASLPIALLLWNQGTARGAPKMNHDRTVRLSTNTPARRLSIALGGGGARGISHLGVMHAVKQQGFQLDHISGISIGAIAGAMCATGEDIESVQAKTLDFIQSPTFRKRRSQMFGLTPAQGYSGSGWMQRFRKLLTAPKSVARALRSTAILPEAVLKHVVESLLPDVAIEDLPVPFSVVTVDVLSGDRVVLDHGSLRDAVRASSSIPGVFPAVKWEDRLLCDIGVFETVPAVTAKQRAGDVTVAVDVSDQVVAIEGCTNILEIMTRMQHLAESELRRHSLTHADVVIRPDIGRRAWFDFNEPEELIELGRQAASESLSSKASGAIAPPTPIASTVATPQTA